MSAIALTTGNGPDAKAAQKPPDDSRSKVMRASLILHDSSPTTAGRKLGPRLGKIDFQFNPKELTIAKSAKWERKNERGAKKSAAPSSVVRTPAN